MCTHAYILTFVFNMLCYFVGQRGQHRQELDELGVEWVFPVPREDWKSDFRMKNYMQTKQSEQFDIIIM
jgi:hypothetical protein